MQTNRKQISALVAWRWEKDGAGCRTGTSEGMREELSEGNEYLFYADSPANVNAP